MAGQVVGYVVDGTILCPTHAEEWAKENNTDLETDERVSPIFDDSEWDYIPTCEECGDPLDVAPTSDGLRWIVEEFGSYEEAEQAFPGVGGRWYEAAQEARIAPAETTGEEEEGILAKMRQLDQILEKLLRG
jgi:uncharacterized Zn finger protein (UPF0148 family)